MLGTQWLVVDEKRPLLKEAIRYVQLEDGTSTQANNPDIETEYVLELWWIPNTEYPFPTLEDVKDGVDEFHRNKGRMPQRIVLPNFNGDYLFGVEITQV